MSCTPIPKGQCLIRLDKKEFRNNDFNIKKLNKRQKLFAYQTVMCCPNDVIAVEFDFNLHKCSQRVKISMIFDGYYIHVALSYKRFLHKSYNLCTQLEFSCMEGKRLLKIVD